MSISCRVFRNEKGDIDFVNTEKGSRSTLFDSLVKVAGGDKEVALTLYALTDIDSFKEIVDLKKGKYKTEFLSKVKGLVKKAVIKKTPEEVSQADDIMYSKIGNEPTYYSNAIGAISNLSDKNPKNTQGWLKQLTDTQKNGGVKNVNQELQWIGLEDYLNEYVKENNPKAGNIPYSVVEDYIKANQIEIVDVSKEEDSDTYIVLNEDGEDVSGGYYSKKEAEEYVRIENEAGGNYSMELYEYGKGETKYSGYQLKGGENYREVLLTMPAKTIENDKVFTVKNRKDFWKDSSNFSAEEVKEGFLVSSIRGGRQLIEKDYYVKTKEDAINSYREDNLQLLDIFSEEQGVEDYDFYDENGTYFNTSTAANIGQAISEYKSLTETKGDEYKSSHWNEKNILAHIRLNEKTLPDGRKVLIVNELQSDISQDLKKEQNKILDRVNKEFDNFLDNLIMNKVIIEEC